MHKFQGTKVPWPWPRSESSRERFGQGPIGRFAPGSELARERKGCEYSNLTITLILTLTNPNLNSNHTLTLTLCRVIKVRKSTTPPFSSVGVQGGGYFSKKTARITQRSRRVSVKLFELGVRSPGGLGVSIFGVFVRQALRLSV